jgi:hypothetical protein
MSRSLSYLRRGLLGIALVGSLGFGATQAFATPEETAASGGSCPWSANGPYFYPPCEDFCREVGGGEWGYCDNGMCVCV